MKKTPQHFKREEVKNLISRILGEDETRLLPVAISVKESLEQEVTTTDFEFSILGRQSQTVNLRKQEGKGFVDGLFKGLHGYFCAEYQSLNKIKLIDYNVNPIISSSKNGMGTESQASVTLSVHLGKNYKIADFQHTSRSMIYSSFSAALEAFEFYINCDRCFHKICMFLEDAKKRNRFDVVSTCIFDLSKLTEVNGYEREKTN